MAGSFSSFREPPSNKSMGIEIECLVNRQVYDDKVADCQYLGFFGHVYDGSIAQDYGTVGQEFVSQPLTREWLKKEIVKLSNKVSWQWNSSCGIHIHVSRKWLSEKKAKAIYTWLATLEEEDKECLFGRASNYYCRTNQSFGSTRYCAVNTKNGKTIEFRMFASGDVKWAQYCVDMVDYLIRNAYHLNVEAARAFHDLHYKD